MKRSKLVRSVSVSLSVPVLALALSVVGCAKSEAPSAAPLPTTEAAKAEVPASDTPNVAAAKEALAKGAILVDVRTPGEFEDGHPAKAVNVPVDELEAKAPGLFKKDQALVVVCASGKRATRAAKALHALGYTVVNGGSVTSFE
jgi:phage shock protein E